MHELRDSEWTTDEEEATTGYMAYPDPTSNLLLHPPTPNDKPNKSNHHTAYPDPTSCFINDDFNTLQCDYRNGVLGTIAYMPTLQTYTDKCPMEEEEPFIYGDIDTLHHDYEDSILEAIEYMRSMNQLSDSCMADDEDYQSYVLLRNGREEMPYPLSKPTPG